MEFRPYYLAREWVRAGHRVQIVAADFSHVRARQPPAGDELIDGIAYRWLATPAYRGNGVGRVWNIACYLAQLWAQSRRLVDEFKPDVVIASSTYPMDFWVARHIARLSRQRAGARGRGAVPAPGAEQGRGAVRGAVLVHEVHDLWPLSPIELSGMSPRHPFIQLCQAAENAACRDADVMVSMLPKVSGHLAAHGLDLRKLHIVPNGITPDEWPQQGQGQGQGALPALRDDVAAAITQHRAAGRTVVGYAGSMGLPNALDVLLDAAALLRSEPLAFVLVGDGHERERLARRVADEGLANVSWLPPIPKAQIPALLARFDIAYIGWQRVAIYRFGIAPNKLMDYLMAGCVVLHSVDAGNDPVAESGCGLTVAPESPPAVADGLRRLAALPAAERAAMGEHGRAFVLAHHSYPVLAQRFLQVMHR